MTENALRLYNDLAWLWPPWGDVEAYRPESELVAAFQCAFRHLRPGGVKITYPDHTKEMFVQGRTDVSTAKGAARPHSLDVTFIENNYDPDPGDHE